MKARTLLTGQVEDLDQINQIFNTKHNKADGLKWREK